MLAGSTGVHAVLRRSHARHSKPPMTDLSRTFGNAAVDAGGREQRIRDVFEPVAGRPDFDLILDK